MTMIAPEQAQQRMEQDVSAVQVRVLDLLAEQGQVPLRSMLGQLVSEGGSPLELVSRALARLLTQQKVTLSPTRELRMTSTQVG